MEPAKLVTLPTPLSASVIALPPIDVTSVKTCPLMAANPRKHSVGPALEGKGLACDLGCDIPGQ